jgi:hypothetical protein
MQSAKRASKKVQGILLPWRRKDSRAGRKTARWKKKISNNDPPRIREYIVPLSRHNIETINQVFL